VDQQLDARGARIGEEVAVVSTGSAGGRKRVTEAL